MRVPFFSSFIVLIVIGFGCYTSIWRVKLNEEDRKQFFFPLNATTQEGQLNNNSIASQPGLKVTNNDNKISKVSKTYNDLHSTTQQQHRSCQRHCPSKRINKICYVDRWQGLNDRMTVIYYLSQLAGYLCAELVLPFPYDWLSAMHNNKTRISHSVQWSDFYNITFIQDHSLVINVDEEALGMHLYGWKHIPGPVFDINKPKYKDWLHIVSKDGKIRNDFEEVQMFTWNQSETSMEGFLWEIDGFKRGDFWNFDLWQSDIPMLPEKLRHSRVGKFYKPEMSPYRWKNDQTNTGCKYTNDDTKSYHLKEMQKRLRRQIYNKSPSNSIYGLLHLRRGDTIKECDTSLERIRKFLECSLNGTEQRGRHFTLLLTSDEYDLDYRQGVLDMTENFSHVSVLDVDKIVREIIDVAIRDGIINLGLRNNYYIFQVENLLRDSNWGDNDIVQFHMALRRKGRCPNCIPVDEWLAKKIEDY